MTPEDRMSKSARDRSMMVYTTLIQAVEEWKRADEGVRISVEGFGSFAELDERQRLRADAVGKLAKLVEDMQ